MNVQMRYASTPQDHIRRMFAETENGEFAIEYESLETGFVKEKRSFRVNWTAEDAEAAVRHYDLLTAALTRIGRLHDQLKDEESRGSLLSKEDLAVFYTYVLPYEPMEVNWEELYPIPPCRPDELGILIDQIRERSRLGDLIEEEELLWKKYCIREEEQSQKRIPFHRRSSAALIRRAMRYERLVSIDAPEIIVAEEGRCLAEELVLYDFGTEEPIVWE